MELSGTLIHISGEGGRLALYKKHNFQPSHRRGASNAYTSSSETRSTVAKPLCILLSRTTIYSIQFSGPRSTASVSRKRHITAKKEQGYISGGKDICFNNSKVKLFLPLSIFKRPGIRNRRPTRPLSKAKPPHLFVLPSSPHRIKSKKKTKKKTEDRNHKAQPSLCP
jgi:hypothetical protein